MTEEADDVGRNFRQILKHRHRWRHLGRFFCFVTDILHIEIYNICCIYITPSETRKIIFLHFLDKKSQNYASMQLKLIASGAELNTRICLRLCSAQTQRFRPSIRCASAPIQRSSPLFSSTLPPSFNAPAQQCNQYASVTQRFPIAPLPTMLHSLVDLLPPNPVMLPPPSASYH